MISTAFFRNPIHMHEFYGDFVIPSCCKNHTVQREPPITPLGDFAPCT